MAGSARVVAGWGHIAGPVLWLFSGSGGRRLAVVRAADRPVWFRYVPFGWRVFWGILPRGAVVSTV